MTGVCCGLTVSESGEGMSWILLLLLSHAGVSTTGTGGMSWILPSMMLHTGVSAIAKDDDRGEYCIVFTVCWSINSLFIEQEAEILKSLILIFCSFDKVANLARRGVIHKGCPHKFGNFWEPPLPVQACPHLVDHPDPLPP